MSLIEINGKTYTERQQPEKKRRMSKIELMAMAIGIQDIYGANSRYSREFPKLTNNSIVDEFALIQAKKSKLTSAERNMVKNRFHKLYMEL